MVYGSPLVNPAPSGWESESMMEPLSNTSSRSVPSPLPVLTVTVRVGPRVSALTAGHRIATQRAGFIQGEITRNPHRSPALRR